ncbi:MULTISPECIES: spore germination protein [Brevibacillus]|uniref:Spore germination protein PA n=2 Tax=Brevibacillus TaxID=55080 RepID=A0A1I3SYC9_9BACL|nr:MULTISPECIES: spore germination protein [Brevibacillus]MEC2128195.1 spore germination protein [Brevibacillus centrosporus]MED1796871.1 spore germination protein [Brevibacillus nitrificans]MED1951555.1 spore germination protein [Brevibacillus centrosporus]MED4909616.1 spore germination protein [Brevibacillus centrosporus]RNB73942.1 spore germination protein [Brevibacillus centrosporus]
MPAIVGVINVNSISGVFNVGDVRKISPVSYAKTFAGGGSFNSGTTLNVRIPRSVVYVNDTNNDDWPAFVQDLREPAPKGRDCP